MCNDKKRILIVDDRPDDINILMQSLSDYAITAATSGSKALELIEKNPHPDLIILDVVMPEMDGYELCQQLKDNFDTADIDIIFVSAHDTINEKLKGYEVGGSDYLIKPIQPNELLQKVKLSLLDSEKKTQNKAEISSAMETAMTVMTNMGELGIVQEFMRSCFTLNSIADLGQLIINTVALYGLDSAVHIFSPRGNLLVSNRNAIPPIEKDLLLSCNGSGAIIERGHRLIVNYGEISMLIKNMPDDSDKCGRLRDHLAVVIESAAAKLVSMEMQLEISGVVKDSTEQIALLKKMNVQQRVDVGVITEDMLGELRKSFYSAGLTEEQESQLVQLIERKSDDLMSLIGNSKQTDDLLLNITERLSRFSL